MIRKSVTLLFVVIFSLLMISVLVGALDSDSLVVGRRLNDVCAEHDTFLAHALQSIPADTLMPGWGACYDYGIIATHPITEIAANGLPPAQWCAANFTGCSMNYTGATIELMATDIVSKVYDNGSWVISTRDISDATTAMVIRVNGIDHGQHNALVFNRRRTPEASSWPEFFVLYANGFIRIKPMGQTDAPIDDPCYGTSAVLGPYRLTPPLLVSAPHPELHPILDQADIRLNGPSDRPLLMLAGRFVNTATTTLISASWPISVTRIDTVETRLHVQQCITGVETISLTRAGGNGVLGFASLSSMWADTDTHDADVLRLTCESGLVYQVNAGDINGTPFGETAPISLTSACTSSLATTSATDHNVGAPDVHIYLRRASFTRLEVTKQASSDHVQAGVQLTYTLRVTNTGSIALNGTVTDTLPLHVAPMGVLTWTLTNLSPGSVWSQQIVVTMAPGYSGTLTNRVQVTTLEGATGEAQITTHAIGYGIYLPLVMKG